LVRQFATVSDEALLAKLREETKAICKRFPAPGATPENPLADKARSAA
jgi:hypothetical protein